MKLRLDTRQILWSKVSNCNSEILDGCLNLRHVKEIREGRHSKEFYKYSCVYPKTVKPTKCFVILYGKDFKLKTLSIEVLSEQEYFYWLNSLYALVNDTVHAPYLLQVERWLRKRFITIENARNTIKLKDVKSFLSHVHCKMSTSKLRELFQEVDTRKCNELTFDEFATLYYKLIFDSNFSRKCFELHISVDSTFSIHSLIRFLNTGQEDIYPIMKKYLKDCGKKLKDKLKFTATEFIDYMFSKQNEVWDPQYEGIYQNMTRPLTHYWIASSHNTYLTGDQISSKSSVEAYIRCLRWGCRCIELDCWDGLDGQPLIYHGHTLTTRIKFVDVIRTIKEHAFVVSPYPVILSIDDNCSLQQQRIMASIMINEFGDMLITQPIQNDETEMPSPEQLKYKFIIKHRKIPEKVTGDEVVPSVSTKNLDEDMYLSTKKKVGVLFLEDPMEKAWKENFFVLADNKLYYTDLNQPDIDNEDDTEEEGSKTVGKSNQNRSKKFVVKAIYDFEGRKDDELSFCKHAVITNVVKDTDFSGWWQGDYGGKRQHFFPNKYVKEIQEIHGDNSWRIYSNFSFTSESKFFGNAPKGSLDLTGALVEMDKESIKSKNQSNQQKIKWILKIYTSNASTPFIVGTEYREDAKEWKKIIIESAHGTSANETDNKKMEQQLKIAKEISDLIIYCRAVPFRFETHQLNKYTFVHNEMSSFLETKAEKLMTLHEESRKFFLIYHRKQFSRVYPNGQRLNSSNYIPVSLWNTGCQMTALNYQTPDKAMQLNQAKFRLNGGCGYVLKPEYMLNGCSTNMTEEALLVHIRIIAGRHVGRSSRNGISNPFVTVKVYGNGENPITKLRTEAIHDNGFNPVWNEGKKFIIQNPSTSFIRFVVKDEDMFSDTIFIGQATYPVFAMRSGYRSIPLKNGYSEEIPLASLLVHIIIEKVFDMPDESFTQR